MWGRRNWREEALSLAVQQEVLIVDRDGALRLAEDVAGQLKHALRDVEDERRNNQRLQQRCTALGDSVAQLQEQLAAAEQTLLSTNLALDNARQENDVLRRANAQLREDVTQSTATFEALQRVAPKEQSSPEPAIDVAAIEERIANSGGVTILDVDEAVALQAKRDADAKKATRRRNGNA